ncbi:hypothetical protein ACKWTF_004125 [Chironomus riparius]
MGTKVNLYKHWKKLVINVSLMLSGSLLILFWPDIWNHILFKQWELKPGRLMYKFWQNPPQPLYLDIYFFNWTNPEEFTNNSSTPKFQEVGPYRFQEFPQKTNITFHENNSTVGYRKQSRYIFIPEQSRGKMTDILTTPNVVALAASNQARSFNILKVKGVELSLAFFGQKISVTKTASELLFEGYEDSMVGVALEIAKIMGINMPFNDNRFGWFYERNESSQLIGHFNVDTSLSTLGQLREWTMMAKPKFLETNCGSYKGASAGDLFPPKLAKKSQMISVFANDMCRSIDLDFVEETEVEGITGRKFVAGDRVIDNGTKYPENECYCNGECVPSGVLNITACRLGAPVFVSYPHFYRGDQYYLEQVEGMKPDKEKHEFFMTLEPKTSLPLEVAGRFQLNLLVKPIPKIKMYRDVPTKFLPIVWFEQYFKVDNQLSLMIKLMLWIPFIGQILGFIIAIIGIYQTYKFTYTQQGKKFTIPKDISLESTKIRLPELSPLVNQ